MKLKKIVLFPALALFLLSSYLKGQQITIVNSQFMPYNVTPEALLNVSIMNNGAEVEAHVVSRLFNISNQELLTVRSSPFLLKQGLNNSFSGNLKVAGVEYSNGNQVDYIKTTHNLPSGTFRICITVILSNTSEPGDEYCDEIESDFNQFLYLVTPFDKDTIESTLPLLSWNHSEPFNALAEGEFYRMVVSEIKDKQGAEEAITVNTPVMVRNYLTVHNLQYPYDAKELQEGKRYAWQVHKMANNIVTNKTEAWEFIVRKPPEEQNLKYVALQPTLSADAYMAYNGRIYFKFIEEYSAKGNLKAFIISDKGKEYPVDLYKDETKTKNTSSLKSTGDNRFELDLDIQNIKPGYYRMVIKNEKKQTFYLKFYLPE
jgi:hypothetical protein